VVQACAAQPGRGWVLLYRAGTPAFCTEAAASGPGARAGSLPRHIRQHARHVKVGWARVAGGRWCLASIASAPASVSSIMLQLVGMVQRRNGAEAQRRAARLEQRRAERGRVQHGRPQQAHKVRPCGHRRNSLVRACRWAPRSVPAARPATAHVRQHRQQPAGRMLRRRRRADGARREPRDRQRCTGECSSSAPAGHTSSAATAGLRRHSSAARRSSAHR